MLDKFDIMKLNELPIEQVAEALGLSVTRHRALCPFHNDSNPSLTFSVRKNRYRCFVCGACGGPIDLVMRYLHKDFLSACKWLSEEHSVVITFPQPSALNPQPEKPFDASRYARFFERPWLSTEARKFLYDERHLDPRVISWCRLTSWKDKQGTPWLQIPYYDRDGKLIGIQNRNLSWSKVPPLGSAAWPVQEPSSLHPPLELCSLARREPSSAPRFRFPAGAQCSIYNLPVLNLLKPGEPLFLTEGCSDCWSMLSAGHKAIAIPSATLLSKKDIETLSTLHSQLSTVFHIFPDQDAAGEQLYNRLVEASIHHSFTLVRHQLPMGCKDFSELYLQRLNPSARLCRLASPRTLISHPSTGFSARTCSLSSERALNVKC